MKRWSLVALLMLLCLGAGALSGCVVEHRRDGGITFRPLR